MFSLVVGTVFLAMAGVVCGQEQDMFNYNEENQGDDGKDFGTKKWMKVSCDDRNLPLREQFPGCPGWPDKYLAAPDWRPGQADVDDDEDDQHPDAAKGNWCMDCSSASNADKCPMGDSHTQGPIHMLRKHGIPNHPEEVECIDSHWMKYFDGSCTWEDYVNNGRGSIYGKNNFLIQRQALKIMQPLKYKESSNSFELACLNPIQNLPAEYMTSGDDNPKRIFPKLDYSKGFPEFWHLNHISIKMPSEFTQEGKQYDATVYYEHHYSVPYEEQLEQVHKVTKKKIGTVVVNLQGYRKAQPDPFLDKVICQFRKTENEMRQACDLPSLDLEYAYNGCWNYEDEARNLQEDNIGEKKPYSNSTSDNNNNNLRKRSKVDFSSPQVDMDKIEHDDADFEAPPQEAFDAFIQQEIEKGTHPEYERKLLNFDHVPWHIYGFLINVRTEYYHRLQASQTIPPCQHNHWRIMKDPLRVSHRQLRELARLMAMRVDENCKVGGSTAGRKRTEASPRYDRDDEEFGLDFNRPIQETTDKHKMKFCECKDWKSKWPEDQEWCNIQDINERFYEHPYNFDTNGKW